MSQVKGNKIFVNARFLTQKITGTQRFAIEICKELIKVNEGIIFLSPKNILYPEYEKLFRPKIIGVTQGHLWEQVELAFYMKGNGGVLINLVNTAPILLKLQIVTVHDLGFLENPNWYSLYFRTFYKLVIPIIIRRSIAILTVSEFSKYEIQRNFKPKSMVTVIYNALPIVFLNPSLEINLTKQKYLLCVSAINPRKNFQRVIKAFNLLNNPEYELIIVGDKSGIFDDSSFSTKTNNKIQWYQNVSDNELVNLYKNATGFIYVSLYEGFGIPILEAQSLGCPVLVSDILAHREVVKDSGIYCNPLSVESIKDGMENLINFGDLNIPRGINNASRFSWYRSAMILKNLIDKFTKF